MKSISKIIRSPPLNSVVAIAAATVPSLKIHIGTRGNGTTFASTYKNTASKANPMMSGARTAAEVQGYRDPAQERARRTSTAQARVRTEPYQSNRRSLVRMEPFTRRRGRMKMIIRMERAELERLANVPLRSMRYLQRQIDVETPPEETLSARSTSRRSTHLHVARSVKIPPRTGPREFETATTLPVMP